MEYKKWNTDMPFVHERSILGVNIMNPTNDSNQSLMEKIVQKTLMSLEGIPEFDSETIDRVKNVVANGDFKKAIELSKAIKPTEEVAP